MKAKLLFLILLTGTLMTSGYREVIIEDEYIEESTFNTDQVLQSYDLWYVDTSMPLKAMAKYRFCNVPLRFLSIMVCFMRTITL